MGAWTQKSLSGIVRKACLCLTLTDPQKRSADSRRRESTFTGMCKLRMLSTMLPINRLFFLLLFGLFGMVGFTSSEEVPKTWVDEEMQKLALPLADTTASPALALADYYYRIPVRPIYKSYPVYHPDKEPAGYFEELQQRKGGRPTVGARPTCSTRPRRTRERSTPSDWTPRMASICARVTGCR